MVEEIPDKLRVERRAERDRMRENRRRSGARNAVRALVPPVVFVDAEPLDRGGIIQ